MHNSAGSVYLRAITALLAAGLGAAQYGWCGYLYSSGIPAIPLAGPEITVHEVAAVFTVADRVTVNGFDFWSFELAPPFVGYAGSIEWAVYTENGGPDRILASGTPSPDRVDSGSYPLLGSTALLFHNLVSTPAFDLEPGSYWLGLKNGPPNLRNFNGFFWAESDSVNGSSFTFSTKNWTFSGLRLSYGVNGPDPEGPHQLAPEPSSLVMIAPAGLGLLLAMCRRQKRKL